MTVKTYDEILTDFCNAFDTYIYPKQITRANTNILFLLLKAVAKGFEVINNMCVLLQNKFNPATCDEDDLIEVAKLVGTDRLDGQPSGLRIVITNTGEDTVTLPVDIYTYKMSEEVSFQFETDALLSIGAGQSAIVFAFSTSDGAYEVTAQNSIEVTAESGLSISEDLSFSVPVGNKNLLGYAEETPLEFRKRILTQTGRQDALAELQTKIRNLPNIFDCNLAFNQETSTVDGIPPFHLRLTLSGSPSKSLAETVAKYTPYPTVGTKYVTYDNDVFVNGGYKVYYNDFDATNYKVEVDFDCDVLLISANTVRASIVSALEYLKYPVTYEKYITEKLFYDAIDALNLPSVQVKNITLYQESEGVYTEVPYVTATETELATLSEVLWA